MEICRVIGVLYFAILVMLILSVFFHFANGILILLLLGWGLMINAFGRFGDKKKYKTLWFYELLFNFICVFITLLILHFFIWNFYRFILAILFLIINILFLVIIILIIVEHRIFVLKEKRYKQYLEQKKKKLINSG